jgi:hypothetical protein
MDMNIGIYTIDMEMEIIGNVVRLRIKRSWWSSLDILNRCVNLVGGTGGFVAKSVDARRNSPELLLMMRISAN